MIENIHITFSQGGVNYELAISVPLGYEHINYAFANAFTELIKKFEANSDSVISLMKNNINDG